MAVLVDQRQKLDWKYCRKTVSASTYLRGFSLGILLLRGSYDAQYHDLTYPVWVEMTRSCSGIGH